MIISTNFSDYESAEEYIQNKGASEYDIQPAYKEMDNGVFIFVGFHIILPDNEEARIEEDG